MKNIDMLWELQQLDTRIIEIEQNEGITDLRKDIDNYKESYNKLLMMTKQKAEKYKQKDAEAIKVKENIVEINLLIADCEVKLYSGEVKKVKALSQLEKDIEDSKKSIKENEALLQKLRTENITVIKQIRRCKGKLEEIKEKIDESTLLLNKKISSSQEQFEQIHLRINEIKQALLPEELAFYNEKKESLYPVVVPYVGDNCGGCQMQFSIIFNQNAQKQESRSWICENCGRLIIVTKENEVEA